MLSTKGHQSHQPLVGLPEVKRMQSAIDCLTRHETDSKEFVQVRERIDRDLNAVYSQMDGFRARGEAGNWLTEIGGVQVIGDYMKYVAGLPRNRETCNVLISLYNTLLGFSSSSRCFAREMGQKGILDIVVAELKELVNDFVLKEEEVQQVLNVINILHNCSEVPGNQQIYHGLKVVDVLSPLTAYKETSLKSGLVAMTAVMTLSHTYSKEVIQNNSFHVEPTTIHLMLQLLEKALENTTHCVAGYHVTEFVIALGNLALDPRIAQWVVAMNGMALMKLLLEAGNSRETECTITTVEALITDETRLKVASVPGLREKLAKLKSSSHPGVYQRARSAVRKLPATTLFQLSRPKPFTRRKSKKQCSYFERSERFKKSLKLSKHLFSPRHNVCFCIGCQQNAVGNSHYSRGEPLKTYAVPIGWARFAVSDPVSRVRALNCEEKWHRAYHGTKSGVLESILRVGDLVKSGSAVLGGKKVGVHPGLFDRDCNPEGFDIEQVLLSPSIKYAEHNAYASPERWSDGESDYIVKVALEVLVDPLSYKTGKQTMAGEPDDRLDPLFNSDELEWSTNQQGSTIIYGLLVKVEEAATEEVASYRMKNGTLSEPWLQAAMERARLGARAALASGFKDDDDDDDDDDDEDSD